jgi:hypothetical protein
MRTLKVSVTLHRVKGCLESSKLVLGNLELLLVRVLLGFGFGCKGVEGGVSLDQLGLQVTHTLTLVIQG